MQLSQVLGMMCAVRRHSNRAGRMEKFKAEMMGRVPRARGWILRGAEPSSPTPTFPAGLTSCASHTLLKQWPQATSSEDGTPLVSHYQECATRASAILPEGDGCLSDLHSPTLPPRRQQSTLFLILLGTQLWLWSSVSQPCLSGAPHLNPGSI